MIESITGKGGSGRQARTRTHRATVDSELGYLRREDIAKLIAKEGFPEIETKLRLFHNFGCVCAGKRDVREARQSSCLYHRD
eukprot:SAG22_NODE_879_length_6707_cov_14.725787_7_plen_82_part_00